jgi:large subunit ribosomal protein L29
MPSKKYLELQEFSDADLISELEETARQYQKMKFDHAIKGLDNPLTLREVRRDIARLKTEASRREIAAMDEGALAKRSNKRARR